MRKKVMLRVLLPAAVASFLSFLPDMARAEEPSPFIRTVSVAYRAISRELLETTVIEDIKIRTQGAINTFSQITVPLNEHFQELDTLEAETVKANGQRIKVEADKILVSGLPNAAQFGVFQADVKNRTIVFPDVEVGDTLHYALKFHGKAPSLPGGFEIFWSVPSGTRYGSVDISLDAPADLAIATRSETFTTEVVAANGRKIHHWRLAPQPYRRAEAGSISARDISPFVTFTSRESIEAVGRTTYADYAPKAEPTAEVRALADEITRGLTDRTAQARAIYDYVAVKIRYFLVYLGRGGSVPHAANEILANKFGGADSVGNDAIAAPIFRQSLARRRTPLLALP